MVQLYKYYLQYSQVKVKIFYSLIKIPQNIQQVKKMLKLKNNNLGHFDAQNGCQYYYTVPMQNKK